jgi:hypothetical protein
MLAWQRTTVHEEDALAGRLLLLIRATLFGVQRSNPFTVNEKDRYQICFERIGNCAKCSSETPVTRNE